MSDLQRVRHWAEALIALHLDPRQWSFGFDNAKTRAGLCNYDRKLITVSRYLATQYGDDEIHQILLHEVAHAIAGPRARHGPAWRAVARELGYVGGRLHDGRGAEEFAPWVGTCPAGHQHYRYRQPARELSCLKCERRFSRQHLISWQRRDVTAARNAARRGARSGALPY